MDSNQIHKAIVIGAGMIATYATYMTLKGIGDAYQSSLTLFEGANSFYPLLFTAIIASVPFVLFLVTYFVHKNKRPAVVSLLSIYSLLVYLSYPTILLIILISVWWVMVVRTGGSPNKAFNPDANKDSPPLT